jgi:Protein of unknown function (DUF1553)/Protein of unknown function (DUF1549)
VVPVLTKAGCNAGACHGTPAGKNGFHLSLRGYDPGPDFRALTRDAGGRRINRVQPDASLILLKATAQVSHGGGHRFDRDSYLYEVLRRWVAQGAQDDLQTALGLARVELSPSLGVYHEPVRAQQLKVVAYYRDGSSREVTKLARFSAAEGTTAEVSPEGLVQGREKGEAVVIAEYLGQMATATCIFLPERVKKGTARGNGRNGSPGSLHNYIDQLVEAKLQLLQIEPSPRSTDEEFLRRVFLDVIGKLPTPDEVRHFLASTDLHKRERLIDDLLERPEFADWWALKWTDRLGCNQRFVGKIGAVKYHEWIREAMLANLPEDELVRTVLTASGGNYGNPPAGFYRRLRDPLTAAEEVAQLFLGVRVQCARCHNHPGERWTQDDYYGLAAFFARVRFRDGPFYVHQYDKEETVYSTRDAELRRPRTAKMVKPKFLGGPEADIPAGADRRAVLARWLTGPQNPFFARAAVNRIWFHLFGRGIVEPVDDFRVTNPPSNAALLDALASDFVQHHFDRKDLIRTILRSRTYQLSSRPAAGNADDDRCFSHARVRLLQAEQLLDAVTSAAGAAEKFPGLPLGTPAVDLPDGEYKHPFLEAFGRPARAMACECERDADTNLTQALQLIGGRMVQNKIHSDQGRVVQLLAAGRPDRELIEELFLATLSRYPTEQEYGVLWPRLQHAGRNRRQAAEDILWALVNHNEFLFQH